MKLKASDIALQLQGRYEGDPEAQISGLAKIEEAKSGELTFLGNLKYAKFLEACQASVIIVTEDQPAEGFNVIRVKDPYTAFAQLLTLFYPQENPPDIGIHSSAVIAADVKLGQDVRIGPNVVVGEGSEIGDNAAIYPGVVIGERVRIGNESTLHAGVSVRHTVQVGNRVTIQDNSVIGSDGFGFAPQQEGDYQKIPQVGTVIIEDDVEIGAGCTIDRSTLGATRIEKGTKLDNLIQVAHNVTIGAHTVIAAQTGISGSATIGKNCMIGGQVGFAGHLHLGDGSGVGAQAGVSKSHPPKSKLFGSPAQELKRELRSHAYIRKLPELVKQINQLERQLQELQDRMSGNDHG
ncbi:MAG: UDP-3-O-(3-hydroxymyristoyl)glucosamine N-acyltransferase [bacterium]|nr:UDP-3-O-(3-hydroxymyristoyl)glucosamine N-acyltransferase [bacterium]